MQEHWSLQNTGDVKRWIGLNVVEYAARSVENRSVSLDTLCRAVAFPWLVSNYWFIRSTAFVFLYYFGVAYIFLTKTI